MGHGVSSVDVFGPPSSQGSQGCSKRCQEDRTKERGENDEKMKKLEDEIVDVRNAVPHIVESVLQRLGVRLPESFDMDLNSEANGEQGRVGKTQGNDVANNESNDESDDESDEETAEETVADA
ncbi:unnamed protein product [Linum trigynum]|uniref:Uncharacterized protein n=1 Tax=Linum trigynum TaxID=586398 RepID=A0AAV2GQJ6_9ROSI